MQDSLRAVLDSVFAGPAYDWQERPSPFGFFRRWTNFVVDRIAQWGAAHPEALRVLFWILLAVLALILTRAFLTMVRGFTHAARPAGPDLAPVVRDAASYRREAEHCFRQGRLLEAMQADFTGLILELDQRRLVRYHPSKTPQEYAGEARLSEPSRAELRDLAWGLYRHLFGTEPVTPALAVAWRARTAQDRYAAAG